MTDLGSTKGSSLLVHNGTLVCFIQETLWYPGKSACMYLLGPVRLNFTTPPIHVPIFQAAQRLLRDGSKTRPSISSRLERCVAGDSIHSRSQDNGLREDINPPYPWRCICDDPRCTGGVRSSSPCETSRISHRSSHSCSHSFGSVISARHLNWGTGGAA